MSISSNLRSWFLGETLQEAELLRAEKEAIIAEVVDKSRELHDAADTNKSAADEAHRESRESVHRLRNFNTVYAGTKTAQQALDLLSRKGAGR